MPTPTIPLPEVQLAEWNAFSTGTAAGLFSYRQHQAIRLLEFPDFSGGDLNPEQRREALSNAVTFRRPLSALALFLGIVAMEDLIRDLAARLADLPSLSPFFPGLAKLRAQNVCRPADKAFKRLDTDPAGVIDPEEINARFMHAMGVAPVPNSEYWHLRDLALIRHTVAHHAGVIRYVDVPRFAHFIVNAERTINPPPDFVRSELKYVYGIGRIIEKAIRSAAFKPLIQSAGPGWSLNPSNAVVELVELFDHFGFIEPTAVAVGYAAPGSELQRRQEVESNRIRAALLKRCIANLAAEYGP